MKELTIEEKAQRYNEAIEKAKELIVTSAAYDKFTIEKIFPKLKSEDEKIREELISFLQLPHPQFVGERSQEKWIDWIEKQCGITKLSEEEQNPADKEYTFKAIPRLLEMVEPTNRAKAYCQKLIDSLTKEGYVVDAKIVGECLRQMNGEDVPMATMDEQNPIDKIKPKFKIGDWVVREYTKDIITTNQVVDFKRIDDEHFGYTLDDETYFSGSWESSYHLWTIKDAKDGDVLASEEIGSIILFKGIENNNIQFYCDYDFSKINVSEIGMTDLNVNRFAVNNNGQHYGSVKHSEDFHPATKEQCNTLMRAMADAGYAFDFNKKEFKLLISNGADFLTEVKEDEDEKIRKTIIELVRQSSEVLDGQNQNNMIAWFNKQGAPSPYSGVSFKYNSHTYGMCARDGGVEVSIDGQLKAFISLDKSFVYPNNPVPLFKTKNFYVSKVDGLIHDMRYNPADKIESKFKVGDWVVDEDDNHTYQIKRVIKSVTTGKFSYDLVGGGYFPSIKENYHLWTIEDIKEGDVLYSKEHNLLWLHKNSEQCHCCINLNYSSNNISIDSDIAIPKDVCPATKEQRELLIQKMKEDVYECDTEKKKLKKIESNSVWNEEDERQYRSLHNLIYVVQERNCSSMEKKELSDWLDFLKDRVQSKQEMLK